NDAEGDPLPCEARCVVTRPPGSGRLVCIRSPRLAESLPVARPIALRRHEGRPGHSKGDGSVSPLDQPPTSGCVLEKSPSYQEPPKDQTTPYQSGSAASGPQSNRLSVRVVTIECALPRLSCPARCSGPAQQSFASQVVGRCRTIRQSPAAGTLEATRATLVG